MKSVLYNFCLLFSEYEATMRQLHHMLINAKSQSDIQCIKIEMEKVIHYFDQQRWQQPFPGEGKKQ